MIGERERKKEVGEKNEFNGLNKYHLSFQIEPTPKGQENWLLEAAICKYDIIKIHIQNIF